MLRIRMVEETIAERYSEWEMRCPVHLCAGQEAIAVGVCANLAKEDYVMSAHRSHGHYLAKGGDLKAMLAEIYGKATGCTGGRGGSMHLVDLNCGFLGATPIVGGVIPVAVGTAFASFMKGERRVSVVFLGEASTEEGVFAESLNFASLKKLPVIFVCENNFFSVYSPMSVRQPAERDNVAMARAYGVYGDRGNGNNVIEVYTKTADAVARAQNGSGPVYLEFEPYRWREHCGPNYDNDIGYRTEDEYKSWRARCPIEALGESLRREATISDAEAGEMARRIKKSKTLFVLPRQVPFRRRTISLTAYMQPDKTACTKREVTYAKAILEATVQCMDFDPAVYIMGLGVPDPKGIFGTTLGLKERFGDERVFDMPVSENGMTGIAIGSAIAGMRPIMTHQRVDFMLLSLDQLINNAAKWHYMFGGKMKVPLTIRLLVGRGWGQGPQHSQSLQALFAHIPGLKVVMPATPYDAKGLMVAAIEDNNPVIYIEHRWLHGTFGHVPKEKYTVPIGKARIMRQGRDITLVSSSLMTIEALKAAQVLAKQGIEVELVDLRTLKPIDEKAILDSVAKTGGLLIVDGAWKSFGAAAEVVAMVAENIFDLLKFPPRRITFPDMPIPTSHALANHYYPTPADIANTCRHMLGLPAMTEEEMGIKYYGSLDVPDPDFTGPF
jgi:2-oxoisovalerate dehydrogenase E1 component